MWNCTINMHKVFFDDDPSFRVFCRINIYHASDYYIKKEVFCVVYGLKRRVLGNCHLLVVPLDVLLYFVYGLHMYASCKYVLVHITALWCVSSALLVFRAWRGKKPSQPPCKNWPWVINKTWCVLCSSIQCLCTID